MFFFMVSSHQEISHGIILSVLFFLNIKTISIFIWLTYIYFPNVLQCIFSTSVPSSLIFPLYIFIIKFLAHFNNNYKKTILEIYWEIQGEKWATMKCMKILGLANSPHPSACHICSCDMEVSSCGPYLCKSCERTGVKCPMWLSVWL